MHNNSCPDENRGTLLFFPDLHQFEFVARTGVRTTFMNRLFPIIFRNTIASIAVACFSMLAHGQPAQERKFVEQSGDGGWFWIVLIGGLVIVGVFLVWRKSRSSASVPRNIDDSATDYFNSHDSYDIDGLDIEREMQLFRKTKRPANKASLESKKNAKAEPVEPPPVKRTGLIDIDTRAFQEKMRKLQYSQLPINSFMNLTAAKLYEPLPESDDPSLLNAIEQADEEYEEDETVRELALKILTAFRTRNSVEALTQIALYDLSSNLRSKAVSTLTDFDHPSVFEPILLACADPTREVRAAAARGLFRLSFDRSNAWKRIMETNDDFRMSHAARAAIESGIAVKSFERLVHEDLKVAYEAFALVAFMIASGETEEIFKAVLNHRDERVKFALLHVLKVRKDERTLAGLEQLRSCGIQSTDVEDRVKDVIDSFEKVPA
ncbi:MAG: HEAT repeat domain-containing protein [Pyrinomonadaceae bacterium]